MRSLSLPSFLFVSSPVCQSVNHTNNWVLYNKVTRRRSISPTSLSLLLNLGTRLLSLSLNLDFLSSFTTCSLSLSFFVIILIALSLPQSSFLSLSLSPFSLCHSVDRSHSVHWILCHQLTDIFVLFKAIVCLSLSLSPSLSISFSPFLSGQSVNDTGFYFSRLADLYINVLRLTHQQ